MRLLCVLSMAVLFSLPAAAQTVTGTLSGRIFDATKAVVPGVKVVALNEQTDLRRETVTNDEGYFVFNFMPLGSYQLTATVQGFKSVRKTGVAVELNKTTVSDFILEPAAVVETVQVTGETPLVETTVGEVKHSMDSKSIEDTPLAGRNFISLVEQVPGFQNALWIGSSNNPTQSTGSYAVFNGTGSRQATFQIDGVNNDDSSENQNRQNVNISSIREFQVLTNSYTAEFGRAGGAVILVQTKSGTNKFHGDAYHFIQNDIFNANGFFSNATATPRNLVRRNQYGWTAGGPLLKNRLFFFHSGERLSNVSKVTLSRFIWLPGEEPRACGPGEVARPGGPYCVDPTTHPNLERDLAFMRSVQKLWDTPGLQGKTPNDPITCADLIASGRPNRCVRVSGVRHSFPDTDYSGKFDWNAPRNTNVALRYQYSRQLRRPGHILQGDAATQNHRQYNIGFTATHVFSPRQTGEFRYGFGNRATLVDVADGNHIPTIRFGTIGSISGTVIGSSTSTPINRRQHDHQFVYNHTLVRSRHTLKLGIDQRDQLLDDVSGDRSRGFWTFGTLDSLASIRNGTGFAGFENFLLGFVTSYQGGFGNDLAENRFGETNLYAQEDWRIRRNLTLNLGLRWEAVRAPREKENRFDYGFGNDLNNIQPRIGFAWQPVFERPWLKNLAGGGGDFVVRAGYGIYHSRLFQSIFSQNQLSIRTQPPNGYAADFSGQCRNEISDPTCGFVFTPGAANRRVESLANGVRVAGGQLIGTLLVPDPELQLPYVQQWNFAISRRLSRRISLDLTYNGNRTIGNPFYDGVNQAVYPLASPMVSVDIGGGIFRPLVFDRVCKDFSDPMCVVRDASGNITASQSGPSRSFSLLTNATATLEQKGIVIENGVPHGYISSATPRSEERRPDRRFGRNLALRNFGWTYYNGMILKLTKRAARGLSFTGSWTWSKAIDTGSEQTFTGVDTNAPSGKQNAARSLRGLSSFHALHRVVLSYGWELPFFRSRPGLAGSLLGGWNLSGVTVFQSGNPFTVVAGYDVNLDGVGNDRPAIVDPSFFYKSIDDGRQSSNCSAVAGIRCLDTGSQQQLPGTIFRPSQSGTIVGEDRLLTPGSDGTGTIGRNTFFSHGINNFDVSASKSFRIREGMRVQMRIEWYNLLNRVTFGLPANTILSATPLGRISSQRNTANYVGAGRDNGSRMGQFSLRFIF